MRLASLPRAKGDHVLSLADGSADDPISEAERFASCYRIEMPRLVRFVIKLGADHQTAVDIAQTAFGKAWCEWPTIRSPRAWLRRVAGRDYIRQARHLREEPVDQLPDDPPPTASLLVDPVELSEQQGIVLDAIAQLPPRQREVMAWSFDGLRRPKSRTSLA